MGGWVGGQECLQGGGGGSWGGAGGGKECWRAQVCIAIHKSRSGKKKRELTSEVMMCTTASGRIH
jgi:hypothetical protein